MAAMLSREVAFADILLPEVNDQPAVSNLTDPAAACPAIALFRDEPIALTADEDDLDEDDDEELDLEDEDIEELDEDEDLDDDDLDDDVEFDDEEDGKEDSL